MQKMTVSGSNNPDGLLTVLPVGVCLFTAVRQSDSQILDFTYMHANLAACQVLGRDESELLGQRLTHILPGIRDAGLFERYVRVVETGEDDHHDYKYQADGIDSWFASWSRRVDDGFVLVFTNISGQRADRLQTTRTARLVQAMYDESPFAKALVAADTGEIQLTNQTFRDLIGNVSGLTTIDRNSPDLSQIGHVLLEVIDEVRRTGISYSVRERPLVMAATGETRFFRLDVRYLVDNKRRGSAKLKRIQVSAFDVTEFVSARLRAEQLAFRLAEEEEQYRTTFSDAPVGIAHLDERGNFTYGNEYLLKLLGIPLAILKSSNLISLCDHPDDKRADLENMLETRRTFRQLEVRIRHSQGSYRWVSLTLSSLRGRDGRLRNFVLVIEDISRRVESRQRLVESMQHKDEFLAVLGHELRNPLAALRSASALLAQMPNEDPQLARICETLDRQTNQMGRLLDDLLEIGRISRGKLSLLRKTLNLVELVRKVTAQKAQSNEAAAYQFSFEAQDNELYVNGDELRLTQVLDNLLTNAVKYTPMGGAIRVSVTTEATHIRVDVADTGVGIEPEFLRRLFVPFEQAPQDLARAQGGLGLGLALAAQIVRAHGGDIAAQSEGREQGSVFSLRLPRVEWAPLSQPVVSEPALETMCFLVVEDNADAAELLQMVLESHGHEVHICRRGDLALQTIQELLPQVVLCDIGLPGLNGYDIARQVRNNTQLNETYLIALSGYGRSQDQDKAFSAGFDAHLRKPADYSDICTAIARVTRRRQDERQNLL